MQGGQAVAVVPVAHKASWQTVLIAPCLLLGKLSHAAGVTDLQVFQEQLQQQNRVVDQVATASEGEKMLIVMTPCWLTH